MIAEYWFPSGHREIDATGNAASFHAKHRKDIPNLPMFPPLQMLFRLHPPSVRSVG